MKMRDENGMTLTEVLTAMAMLGMVVVLFMNISGYSALSVKRSSDFNELRSIAEKRLHMAREHIRTAGTIPADEITDSVAVSYRISAVPAADALGGDVPDLVMQAVVLWDGQPQWLFVEVSRLEDDERYEISTR